MTMTERRSKTLRLAVAILLVVPAVVASVSSANASPSKAEVEAAKQKLATLQEHFATVNENYNEALYQLQQAQEHLAEAKAMRDAAQKESDEARGRLEARAVQAYTDMGSQYEALLSASSLTEFSDRLEFLGARFDNLADGATFQRFADLERWNIRFSGIHAPTHVRINRHKKVANQHFPILQ